jgi:hypothetical protein
MKKLLFLDFDGVLHPNFCQSQDYFSRVDLLIEAIDDRKAELEIIISSSWRFHHSFDEILGYLPRALQRLISGVTPEVEPGRHQRYREICEYLSQREGSPDWRALDDDIREFPKGCPKLIVISGRSGLNNTSGNLLRHWLDRKDKCR